MDDWTRPTPFGCCGSPRRRRVRVVTSHVFCKTVLTVLDEAKLSAREIADVAGHADPSIGSQGGVRSDCGCIGGPAVIPKRLLHSRGGR